MASYASAGIFQRRAASGQLGVGGFAGYLVMAGLTNALIVAFLFCYLPPSHAPSILSLLIRATVFVAIAVVAGVAGARFYWNRSETPFATDPPLSFPLFALVNAAAWLWVPSVVLLSRQDSPASAGLAALAAALLAIGLRKIMPADLSRQGSDGWSRELFADSILTPRYEAYGYIIALGLYYTGYALVTRYYLNAGAPLAACAFLFAWKRTLPPVETLDIRKAKARVARRLALLTLPAILATLFVLLFGVEHRNHALAELALADGNGAGGGDAQGHRNKAGRSGADRLAYESIILWPVIDDKRITAPLPAETSILASGSSKPLVIEFDGPYWYFQPPGKRPSPQAHQAHGTPLALDIQSRNFLPLVMEAHQSLGSPIRLARCREISVGVLNRENHPGTIAIGLLLTDTFSPGKPTVYLGQQTLPSSAPDQFTVKMSPVAETLRFPVPAHASLRRFDQITVMIFPDGEHFELGPKVAIKDFQLMPR